MNDNEAMRHAVANGHLDIVKYLVKKGVDPRLDKNLMVYATEWGRQAVVSYLKSLGC
jgi:ankyrin repeat protein